MEELQRLKLFKEYKVPFGCCGLYIKKITLNFKGIIKKMG
jgi:hypothetical protein